MTLRWKIAQWFELKWWQNYLHDKEHAAYKNWKKNYWQNILEKITVSINLTKSSTIADLGCGPAGIFMVFPEYTITAVDPLVDTYQAQTGFFKKSDYPQVAFVNTTIEDFNTTEKFDLVFCMNAINHVRNINQAFNKLKTVCKDGGSIIISIDAHNHSFFKHLFRAIPGDILHPHQYDLAEYAHMLSSGGWKLQPPLLLKHEFFFDHYLLVAQKLSSPQ